MPFTDDDAFAAALPLLDDALDVFTAAAAVFPATPPLPTLADAGSAARRAHPGGGQGLSLDEARLERLARNVAEAARRIRDRGLDRPSTTTPAPTSRLRMRSSHSSPAPTWASPSTPAASSSAVATRSRACAVGATGSTTSI